MAENEEIVRAGLLALLGEGEMLVDGARVPAAEMDPAAREEMIAMAQDREECLNAGMDDHLGKPFREDDLASMLQRHLRPRPSAVARERT